MINIRCFYCKEEACAKVGTSKGSLLSALLGRKCWDKAEKYVCRNHYIIHTTKVPKVKAVE